MTDIDIIMTVEAALVLEMPELRVAKVPELLEIAKRGSVATLREACNIQCQGCRENWALHKRTPSGAGNAELYHKPWSDQVSTWVTWPMDCQAWRIRKLIEPEANILPEVRVGS